MSSAARAVGYVKRFDGDRGFGFIKQEGDAPDLFVHISDLQRSKIFKLAAGERLTFEVMQHEKGPRAVNVQRAHR